MNTVIEIDCSKISSMDSFHDVFSAALGFPKVYGRNMNAWIDCMTSIDEPEDGLSKVHVPKGGFLVLRLSGVDEMTRLCPLAYEALVDDAAFVNHRRMEAGEPPILVLSYYADSNRSRV